MTEQLDRHVMAVRAQYVTAIRDVVIDPEMAQVLVDVVDEACAEVIMHTKRDVYEHVYAAIRKGAQTT